MTHNAKYRFKRTRAYMLEVHQAFKWYFPTKIVKGKTLFQFEGQWADLDAVLLKRRSKSKPAHPALPLIHDIRNEWITETAPYSASPWNREAELKFMCACSQQAD